MKKQIKLVVAAFAIMLVGVTSAFAQNYVEGQDFNAPLGVYSKNGTISKNGTWYLRFYEDSEGYVNLQRVKYRNGEWVTEDNYYHTLEWTSSGNMKAKLNGRWTYVSVPDKSDGHYGEVAFQEPGDNDWVVRVHSGDVDVYDY